ncbi:hypothetical protein AWV80_25900 [Cupriavidus sp. UYMU48A]|nr:hypothetical protein AWV80_25900 [Cupriavidus sp. UYMU48A]
MAVFGDCENRAFTTVEGALSQRLIVWLAEGSDHCGHDKGGRPGEGSEPSVRHACPVSLAPHFHPPEQRLPHLPATLMTMNTRDVP